MKLISCRLFLPIFCSIHLLLSKKSFDFCVKDADCDFLNTCSPQGECVHKDFIPAETREIFGCFAIIIGSALSNAGGIGGGGLLIPILLLILNFKTHEAIPISKLMIFTGAVTSFYMGLNNKHPFRNVSTVDLNIAILLIPMLLLGTMVGCNLNKAFPPWIILFMLTLVLIVNTYKTGKKAISLWEGETKDMKRKLEKELENEKENLKKDEEDYLDKKNRKFKVNDDFTEESDLNPIYKKEIIAEMEKDKSVLNIDKLIFLKISYILLLMISLVKGSDHMKSIFSVESCSYTYWFIYFAYIPMSIGITYFSSRVILREYEYRKSINFPYHPKDVKWNPEIFFYYPLYGFFGGTMAGLLGIGGGLILGPLLLELGLHPTISTATSNFLVLFTSSSTSLQFILMGMMNLSYGFFLTICSTLGSYIGTYFIHKLVEKTGRISILIFSLTAVLAISTIFIPAHTLLQTIQKYKDNYNIWEFKSPC